MQKILLGAIIAATVLLVYPSLMMPEQSVAQKADQSASTGNTVDQSASTGNTVDQSAITDNTVAGGGLPCNTSAPNSAGASLTVDGITGPDGSPCVFEIKDFSFGVENPTTIGSATGGAGAGKIKFNEFTIKKISDSASPAFFKNLVAGVHYKTVTLEMRKAGGDPQSSGKVFLKYTFNTVFTTKIDWSGPGDEGPTEQITFVYGKLSVEYETQNPDGSPAPITSCYDVQHHRIC